MYAIPETPGCLPPVSQGFTGTAEFAQHANFVFKDMAEEQVGEQGKGKRKK